MCIRDRTKLQATLDEAIVDSSVLMCILMGEPAAPLLVTALQKANRLYIGAATRAEAWLAAFLSLIHISEPTRPY